MKQIKLKSLSQPPLRISDNHVWAHGAQKPLFPCAICPCYLWPSVFRLRLDRNARQPLPTCQIFFLGESPSHQELLSNKQFVSPMKRRVLNLFGAFEKNIVAQNAVRCSKAPLPTRVPATPPPSAIPLCAKLLARELHAHNPYYLVAVGDYAIRSLIHLLPTFRERIKADLPFTRPRLLNLAIRDEDLPNLRQIIVFAFPSKATPEN